MAKLIKGNVNSKNFQTQNLGIWGNLGNLEYHVDACSWTWLSYFLWTHSLQKRITYGNLALA